MYAVLIGGLIAGLVSVPHCALMCGPLGAFVSRRPSGLLHYQIGRTFSYTLLGAVAGLLGQSVIRLLWESRATTALSWALALLLAIAAYRAWPRAQKSSESSLVSLRPRNVGGNAPERASFLVRLLRRFPQRPLLLGVSSALIPCAALWGGVVIAASSSSLVGGALAMFAFSLTSGTGVLASTFVARRIRGSARRGRGWALILAVGALLLVLRPLPMSHSNSSGGNASGGNANSAEPVHCPLHPRGTE